MRINIHGVENLAKDERKEVFVLAVKSARRAEIVGDVIGALVWLGLFSALTTCVVAGCGL